MKTIFYVITFVLVILFSNSQIFAQLHKGNIRIEVDGFVSDEGKARILLFSTNEREAFPSKQTKAFQKYIVLIKNKKVIFEFNDIPYGDYAISVHHDKNDDGIVNTNWVGIPNEGLGCTNDAKGFFKPPSFEQAKVNLNSKSLVLTINMVN